MNIIKEGVLEPKIYRFKCGNCGCIFDMDLNNAMDRELIDLGPFVRVIYPSTTCPCCEYITYGERYVEEEEDADS